jgi:hypothetical protein
MARDATNSRRPAAVAVSAIVGQLPAGVGVSLPDLPAPPAPAGSPAWPALPGFPNFPGLPGIAFPPIPGLDPCMFLECLAARIDGSGGSGGGHVPGPIKPGDPVGTLVGEGIGAFNRARDFVEEKLRDAERRAKDLLAAEKAAAAAVQTDIQAARKPAEKEVEDLRNKGTQLGNTVATTIAQSWPFSG